MAATYSHPGVPTASSQRMPRLAWPWVAQTVVPDSLISSMRPCQRPFRHASCFPQPPRVFLEVTASPRVTRDAGEMADGLLVFPDQGDQARTPCSQVPITSPFPAPDSCLIKLPGIDFFLSLTLNQLLTSFQRSRPTGWI